MRKDVGDAEDRVFGIVADCDVKLDSVPADDDSVDCQRHCEPLVVFDSAVVVGVEEDEFLVLVEWIRLQVEPWAVGVSSDEVEPFGQRRLADSGEEKGLSVDGAVDSVPRLELLAGPVDLVDVAEAAFSGQFDELCVDSALGLRRAQEVDVVGAIAFEDFLLALAELLPAWFTLEELHLLVLRFLLFGHGFSFHYGVSGGSAGNAGPRFAENAALRQEASRR